MDELNSVLQYIGIALAGLLMHYLKEIVEIRQQGQRVHFWSYFGEFPYKTLLTVGSVVVAVYGLREAGELNGMSAFLTGYAANSMAGALPGRTQKFLQD